MPNNVIKNEVLTKLLQKYNGAVFLPHSVELNVEYSQVNNTSSNRKFTGCDAQLAGQL